MVQVVLVRRTSASVSWRQLCLGFMKRPGFDAATDPDLTAPPCLAPPPAIPSSPADLQIGRKQLLRPTPL